MAWPPRRSSGRSSRRQRNIALLGRAATIAAVAIAAMLLVLSRASPDRYSALRSSAADLVAPLWAAVLVPLAEVQAAAGSVADYFNAVEKVRLLEGRDRMYEIERERHLQALHENRELKKLLKVSEPERERIGVFAISGSSTGAYVRYALISGGARDGIEPGQPVFAASGLIGRTVDVGNRATRVMLITDVSSRVPVRVVRTGLPALLIGKNLPLLDIDLSGPSNAVVRVGDRLVTSGDGGLFPPGLPVATVARISGDMPEARPTATPDGLEYVIVERPYMPPILLPEEQPQEREAHPEAVNQTRAAQ
ncbi:rod shape-determining protein MreC [Sphingosinicella soli]|uniref:Cell shape-determining protein MreC n=1 Tax=Sphingosinicella soli TaxID=333708 RepID=A0A7W7B478_9SPHN|nr:rod shape-determining protein MreC [Sphingosinicella soli]MBB4633629.1 rod shape-determining protein MreC [Sphingosinicella soli]